MEGTGEIKEEYTFTFKWEIQHYFSLSQKTDVFYTSPEFEFADATWSLEIYPNGQREDYSTGWVSLYLYKRKSELVNHAVNFTWSIIDMDGIEYIRKVKINTIFIGNEDNWGWDKFVDRSELIKDRNRVVSPDGMLVISCTLSSNWEPDAARGVQQTQKLTSKDDCGRAEKVRPKPHNMEHSGKETFKSKGVEKMIKDFKDLLFNECDCDVTLKVKGRDFRTHKLILGARSPVFYSMFKHDTVERNSGIVDITDCDPDAFQDFLLYLYSGKVEKLNTCHALNLYSVADKYGVDDLKLECLHFIENNLSVDTFGDIISLAMRHNETSLIKTGAAFFTKNIREIIVTVKWQSFVMENPIAGNELHIVALNSIMSK